MMKRCVICNQKFEARACTHKTCSRKCSAENEKQLGLIYHRKHRKKRLLAAKEWSKNNRERINKRRRSEYWADPERSRAFHRFLYSKYKKRIRAAFNKRYAEDTEFRNNIIKSQRIRYHKYKTSYNLSRKKKYLVMVGLYRAIQSLEQGAMQ